MKIERLDCRVSASWVGLRRSGSHWLVRFDGLSIRISTPNATKLARLLNEREV